MRFQKKMNTRLALVFQITRFLIGGFFVFLIGIGLLYVLVDILNIWYLWATSITFLISLGVSFVVQKYWTFRDRNSRGFTVQLGVYASIQLFNFGLNGSLMYVGVDKLHIPYLLSQFLTAALISVWSFFAYRYVFGRREGAPDVAALLPKE